MLQRAAWDERMLALAGRVSPRSIDANEPVACIYEIIKYCGMEMKKRNEQAPDERSAERALLRQREHGAPRTLARVEKLRV